MPQLILVAIGSLPARIIQMLSEFLPLRLAIPCTVSNLVLDPAPAYDAERGQYDCRRLLPVLDLLAHRSHALVLGVADVDLYSTIFTFVFGEARLGGRAGMLSIHRLRPTIYGLPEDTQLLEARARREALHEIGHLLGLVHCRLPDCVMRTSSVAEEVDLKSDDFCDPCRRRIAPDSR